MISNTKIFTLFIFNLKPNAELQLSEVSNDQTHDRIKRSGRKFVDGVSKTYDLYQVGKKAKDNADQSRIFNQRTVTMSQIPRTNLLAPPAPTNHLANAMRDAPFRAATQTQFNNRFVFNQKKTR